MVCNFFLYRLTLFLGLQVKCERKRPRIWGRNGKLEEGKGRVCKRSWNIAHDIILVKKQTYELYEKNKEKKRDERFCDGKIDWVFILYDWWEDEVDMWWDVSRDFCLVHTQRLILESQLIINRSYPRWGFVFIIFSLILKMVLLLLLLLLLPSKVGFSKLL